MTACQAEPPPVAFEMFGVVHNEGVTGSTIGLWVLPDRTVKFGEGDAGIDIFSISFRLDPPIPEALDGNGIGVGFVGMLRGLAIAPEGEIDPTAIQLIGLSTDSAVIYKTLPGDGPFWITRFPLGYSCGVCDRGITPNAWIPADCTFVTIEPVFDNPCGF